MSDNTFVPPKSTSPTLGEYLEASNATYQPTTTENNVLIPFTPSDGDFTPFEFEGKPVVSTKNADGFSAEAFLDKAGHVIIAYEGTVPVDLGTVLPGDDYALATDAADKLIAAGQVPQALLDAQHFAQTVISDAESEGVSKGDIFLTGHSLGGAEAEAAALVTGLGGATFGAPGIAIQNMPTAPFAYQNSPLVNYVDYGDPVGNLGAGMPNAVSFTLPGIFHVGQVQMVGSAADGDKLKSAIENINSWKNNVEIQTNAFYRYVVNSVAGYEEAYITLKQIPGHLIKNYADDIGYVGKILDNSGNAVLNVAAQSSLGFRQIASSSADAFSTSIDYSSYSESFTGSGALQQLTLRANDGTSSVIKYAIDGAAVISSYDSSNNIYSNDQINSDGSGIVTVYGTGDIASESYNIDRYGELLSSEFTFSDGNSMIFNSGDYQNLSFNGAIITATLTAPDMGSLATLSYNAGTESGTVTLADGLVFNLSGASLADINDNLISSATPTQVLVNYLGELGIQTTQAQLDMQEYNSIVPAGTLGDVYREYPFPINNNTVAEVQYVVLGYGLTISGDSTAQVSYYDQNSGSYVNANLPTDNVLYLESGVTDDIASDSIINFQTLDMHWSAGYVILTESQLNEFSSIIDGGNGVIVGATSGTFDLSHVTMAQDSNISAMYATSFDGTTLIGNDGNRQALVASALGDDTLIAGNGAGDVLIAGKGDDVMTGGNGGDTFVFNSGLDLAQGGDGNDTFVLTGTPSAGTTIQGGSGNNTLISAYSSSDLVFNIEFATSYGFYAAMADTWEYGFSGYSGYIDITQISISNVQTLDASVIMTVAQLQQFPTVLSKFSILDTAENIQAALPTLVADGSLVNQITATDDTVTMSAATFLADQSIANAFVGGVSIVDTTADIAANFSALAAVDMADGWNAISSITATDGIVELSIADLNTLEGLSGISSASSAAEALSKISDGYVISDTAANIASWLASGAPSAFMPSYEKTDLFPNAIIATDSIITVSSSVAVSNPTLMDAIAGGYTVSDTAINVEAYFDQLANQCANITSIEFTDANTPTLYLTSTQLIDDASLLPLITGAYNLDISGYGSVLSIDVGATITLGGQCTLVGPVSDNGSITVTESLAVQGSLSGVGEVSIENGASISIIQSVAAGSLIFDLGKNANLTVNRVGVGNNINLGGDDVVTIGASVASIGSFSTIASMNAVINGFDAGDAINWQGAANGTVYSEGVLTLLKGTTIVGELNVGGNFAQNAFSWSALGSNDVAISLKSDLSFGPVVTFTNIFPDSGAGAAGELSDTDLITFSGTVSAGGSGDTVEIYDGTTDLGSAEVSNGAWSFKTTLSAGVHNGFTAIATGQAGDKGEATESKTINVVQAPEISGVMGAAGSLSVTVSGSVAVSDASATVSIYDGSVLIGKATPTSTGQWNAALTLSSLQGAQEISARLTDAAGVALVSNTVNFEPESFSLASDAFPSALGTIYNIAAANSAGEVVGNGESATGYGYSFIENGGAFQQVAYPGSESTQLDGIDDAGDVVGTSYFSNGNEISFQYSATQGFNLIAVPGATSTYVAGINGAGVSFGGFSTKSGSFGFVERGGVYTTITPPGAAYSNVVGVDGTGEILVNSSSGSFIDRNGAFSAISVPGSTSTSVQGVNNAGYVFGTYNSSNNAFVEQRDSYTTISVPGASYTSIIGVDTNGDVIGSYYGPNGNGEFFEQNGVYTNISVHNAPQVTFVTGVADSGQIVGDFETSNGVQSFVTINGAGSLFSIPGAISGGVTINGVNAAGDVYGGYEDASYRQHGFIHAANGVVTIVDDPNAQNGITVAGVDSGGDVAGTYIDSNFNPHGFINANGAFTTVDVPEATGTTLYGIVNSSEIFGAFSDQNYNENGFVSIGGVVSTIDDPNASTTPNWSGNGLLLPSLYDGTAVTGADSSGDLFGTYVDANGDHGFECNSQGGFTTIDAPGAVQTVIDGVAGNGAVVGAYETANGAEFGFIENGGVFTTYNFTGGDIVPSLSSVAADGTIVGSYYDALGSQILTVTPMTSSPTTHGVAVDGYIAGATVFADANNNGILDLGEAEGTTDATGKFTLLGGSGPIVLEGGTDTFTHLANTLVLTAPAGSTVVTPLTTLVDAVAGANADSSAITAAQTKVLTALGLSSSLDLSTFDPVASAFSGNANGLAAFAAGAKVADAISALGSALAGPTGLSATAEQAVVTALASQIANNSTVDLSSAATLNNVATVAGLTLAEASAAASVVAAANVAVDQAASQPGATPLAAMTTVSAVQQVTQGAASTELASDPSAAETNYSGSNLTQEVDAAQSDVNVYCFYPSVLIATPDGEKPVETLDADDLVLTADGAVAPIRWMGRQTISRRFADPLRILPIRISAGALGEGLPRRDLLVSPDHALLIDGVLVHAGALVNGASITRETNVPETFVYYHVELDDHSLILAENVPAETFIDNVDRMNFDNWAEHEALYPEGKPIEEMPYPRAKARRQVPMRIRGALDRRAAEIGAVAIAAA